MVCYKLTVCASALPGHSGPLWVYPDVVANCLMRMQGDYGALPDDYDAWVADQVPTCFSAACRAACRGAETVCVSITRAAVVGYECSKVRAWATAVSDRHVQKTFMLPVEAVGDDGALRITAAPRDMVQRTARIKSP